MRPERGSRFATPALATMVRLARRRWTHRQAVLYLSGFAFIAIYLVTFVCWMISGDAHPVWEDISSHGSMLVLAVSQLLLMEASVSGRPKEPDALEKWKDRTAQLRVLRPILAAIWLFVIVLETTYLLRGPEAGSPL
jgi:hypothetical protein